MRLYTEDEIVDFVLLMNLEDADQEEIRAALARHVEHMAAGGYKIGFEIEDPGILRADER